MFLFRSRRIRMLFTMTAVCYLALLALRVIFFLHYYGFDSGYDAQQLRHAFYLGIKFDLRLALLIMMPLYFLCLLPWINLLNNRFSQIAARIYLSLASIVVMFFYIVDFAYFGYLGERLDSSILRFAETPDISLQMVWESYPVVWLVLLDVAMFFLTWWLSGLGLKILQKPKVVSNKLPKITGGVLAGILILLGLIGRLDGFHLHSLTTLRWGEAYFANSPAVAAVALNPILFFYDTLDNRGHPYDENIVKSSYPEIMKYLNAEPDTAALAKGRLNYRRDIPGNQAADYVYQNPQPPNIVLIHLESLGANRVGAMGNPLDPTPILDDIIGQSHFFPNFFVPSVGTARTVFGVVTGIPDVSFGGTTASRNPQFMNQQTVVDSLQNYEKYYFLGGSANWANIRAVLKNNIEDLHLYEEGSWKSPVIDVWGISDRSLFTESNEILNHRDTSKPFIAFIQMADNHRPFTIPDDDSGFTIKDIADSEVQKHGFISAAQFNAIRLLDYNIGYYLNELVPNSNYANNTLFLMYGDHNDKSNPSPHMKQDDTLSLTSVHVPFLIYGPGVLKQGMVIKKPMSLIDAVPSAAWLAGVPYTNTTLGRVIYTVDHDNAYALIHGGDRSNRPTIGLYGEDYYLQMLYNGKKMRLHDLQAPDGDVGTDVREQHPQVAARMRSLLLGLYNTSFHMMDNNHKIHSGH